MAQTREQLEAELKMWQARREEAFTRALADHRELAAALQAAEAACRKVKADCDRALAQAEKEDERAERELERITAALAAVPNTMET